MIAGAAPNRSCQSVPSRFKRISTVAGFRSAVGQVGDRPSPLAVEPFFAALKAVHAGKAEEVEDEASGSAMRAVYPCPVDTVLTLIPRNLLLSLQIGAFCRDFGG